MEQTVFVCSLVVFLVSSHAVLTHYTVESNTFSSVFWLCTLEIFLGHPILCGYWLVTERMKSNSTFSALKSGTAQAIIFFYL